MLSGPIINRYTAGLYSAAQSHGLVDRIDDSLKLVADTLGANPEFRSFLEHPLIGLDEKEKVFKEVFGSQVEPFVVRFVHVLLARGRASYLTAVYERFHAMAQESKGVVEVSIETAMPLSEDEAASLSTQLGQALGKKVSPVVRVNKDLIAGYRVQVGNRVLDATVRGALTQFGQKLLGVQTKSGK